MTTRTLVMAVPWNEQRATVARMLASVADAEIVWDTDRSAVSTWRATMLTAGDDPVLCLEDDIALASNWRERVEAVIAEHPDDVIQFFSLRDERDGSGYRAARTFSMNQCYYLPRGVAAELLVFEGPWREQHPELIAANDWSIRAYLQSVGRQYWMHVPSLVQHREWRSTINPKRSSKRQSKVFDEG